MQKTLICFLILVLFFGLATIVAAQSVRDGPVFAAIIIATQNQIGIESTIIAGTMQEAPDILASKDMVSLAVHLTTTRAFDVAAQEVLAVALCTRPLLATFTGFATSPSGLVTSVVESSVVAQEVLPIAAGSRAGVDGKDPANVISGPRIALG